MKSPSGDEVVMGRRGALTALVGASAIGLATCSKAASSANLPKIKSAGVDYVNNVTPESAPIILAKDEIEGGVVSGLLDPEKVNGDFKCVFDEIKCLTENFDYLSSRRACLLGDAVTDNAPLFKELWKIQLDDGLSSITFENGIYNFEGDMVLSAHSLGTGTSRNMYLKGQGQTSFRPWITGSIDKPTGTVLSFADGARMVMPFNRTGVHLERMSIIGKVNGDSLIKSEVSRFGNHMNVGGGLNNMLVINNHQTAVLPNTCVMNMSAVFGTYTTNNFFFGSADARKYYNDLSRALPNLYHGCGWRISTEGQGSQGFLAQNSFTGFETGIDIGWSVAEYTNQEHMQHTQFVNFQFQFSARGVNLKRGIRKLEIINPKFEFITEEGVHIHGGAGELYIKGGNSGDGVRGTPAQVLLYANFKCGNKVAPESVFKLLSIENHIFGITAQAGIYVYGGEGEIIVDSCTIYDNGGLMFAFDAATFSRGYPDILIKNIADPDPGFARLPRSRIAREVTTPRPHARHVQGDDFRYLVRIEDGGFDDAGLEYGGGIVCPIDLDFNVRKYPPVECIFDTSTASMSVILGNRPSIGQDTTIFKRFAPNKLNIVIDANTTLRDGTGTEYTNQILSLSDVGYYKLTREGENRWWLAT